MTRNVALHLTVAAALAAAAVGVYAQSRHFGFVNLDDGAYIYLHADAQRGLSFDSTGWAFSTLYLANYIPLTWLTYFADFQRAGLDAGAYHTTNVLFHAMNSALVFLALRALTRRMWPSALVAALFALHPLHVESVAWISERKDVVSTFFGLLALWAYAGYARAPKLWRYLLIFVLLACSLLAKPMLVTFPFLLLVLDFWPLNRATDRRPVMRLILEKTPLIALAAAFCVVTIVAQREANALPDATVLSIGARMANAATAYTRYLVLTVWPHDLIPYYPHPKDGLAGWEVAGASSFLAIITIAALLLRKRAPYLLVGWFWYLGTLVPVIGLIQVGGQALADRYTYVPLLGIFIAAAWALADLVARVPALRVPVAAISVAVLALCGALTHAQTARWRDNVTLYEYTLRISPANSMALPNLGEALLMEKKYDDAVATLQRAITAVPGSAAAHANLGLALRNLRRFEEAGRHLAKAVQLEPASAKHRSNFALVLMDTGQLPAAQVQLNEALKLDPNYPPAQVNLGNLRMRQGKLAEAEALYRAALTREPHNADALTNLGALHAVRREYPQAETRLREALALEPGDAVTRTNLAAVLLELGNAADARREAEEALRVDPKYGKARALLTEIDRRSPR